MTSSRGGPMLELGHPWLLTLLAAPLLAWWLLPPYREPLQSVRVPFFEKIAGAARVTPARGGLLMRRNLAQKVLAPVVWLLLVVALAQPQLVEPPLTKTESARDLMLAVDLSGSMDATDMVDEAGARVSRLDAVKVVLDDFIARREGDRIGLIVFGTEAFVQAPFTQDHDLVRTLLGQLQPAMAGPQTMLGDGIGLGIRAFEQSEAEDRVVVLLTDGSDTGSRVPPTKAAEIAGENAITIHTVAVGDPDGAGDQAVDLETLDAIAEATGGVAFRADDREQLEDIYAQIDALTPEEIETTTFRPLRPLFHWPLGAAVVLLLLYHAGMAGAAAAGRLRTSTHDA